MDSLGGNVWPFGSEQKSLYAGLAFAVIGSVCIGRIVTSTQEKKPNQGPGLLKSFFLFFYSSFIKPHEGDSKGTQQDALESFYKTQAGAYDSTRKVLLRGREDMLALVAAQLEAKDKLAATSKGRSASSKKIWVDVCNSSYNLPS